MGVMELLEFLPSTYSPIGQPLRFDQAIVSILKSGVIITTPNFNSNAMEYMIPALANLNMTIGYFDFCVFGCTNRLDPTGRKRQ